MPEKKQFLHDTERTKQNFCDAHYFLITSPPGRKVTNLDRKVIKNLQKNAWDWCIGREYAPSTRQQHIHLYLCMPEATSLNTDILPGWYFESVEADRIEEVINYVKKDGNYKHKREEIPEPYNIKKPNWKKWQQAVLDIPNEKRKVILVVDTIGNTGKTYLSMWHAVRHKAAIVPVLKDYRDFVRMAFKIAPGTQLMFVDIPRALGKAAQKNLYAAIETVKNGYAFDERYEFRYAYFQAPKIVVFSNQEPDMKLLSKDRWIIIRPENYDEEIMERKREIEYQKERERQQEEIKQANFKLRGWI